jgi:ribonuclease J
VSGHAPAGELLYVLNLVRPGNFIPVHGEWRHLKAHAELAALTGVPDENIVIAEDGVVVDLIDGRARVTGTIPCGYVYVDGLSVGEVTETSLKDRLILGEEGFVSVVIVVDSTTGKMVAGPEIHARGSGIDDSAFEEVRPRIEEALARAAAEGINEVHQLRQLVRRTVGRWVNENYRRRPMIIPVLVEVTPGGSTWDNRLAPASRYGSCFLPPGELTQPVALQLAGVGARQRRQESDGPGVLVRRDPLFHEVLQLAGLRGIG